MSTSTRAIARERCFTMPSLILKLWLATAAFFAAALPATAQEFAISEDDINVGKQEYSPYLHQSYPNRVFWGDTHLHTSYSTDAGMVGNTLGPEEALRFARGEKVISSTGVPARLISVPAHRMSTGRGSCRTLASIEGTYSGDAGMARRVWGDTPTPAPKS